MKCAGYVLLGMLASFGVMGAVVLAGHPLARYAVNEALQQDVAALARAFWH